MLDPLTQKLADALTERKDSVKLRRKSSGALIGTMKFDCKVGALTRDSLLAAIDAAEKISGVLPKEIAILGADVVGETVGKGKMTKDAARAFVNSLDETVTS